MFASLGLVALGLVIAVISGFGATGSIVGGVVAGIGVVPAAWGMWAGIQHKTQGAMAGPTLMIVGSLGTAAALIIVGIIAWIR